MMVKHQTALFTGNDRKFGNEHINQSCNNGKYDESMADRNTCWVQMDKIYCINFDSGLTFEAEVT